MGFFIKKSKDYLGKGIAFPFILVNGKVTTCTTTELIQSSIRIILAFLVGSRFMLGEFGARIEQLLEDPNDLSLASTVELLLRDALADWEKRIEVTDIELVSKNERLEIKIFYTILNTQVADVLVWPYYKEITT